jgi:hypothetical protein
MSGPPVPTTAPAVRWYHKLFAVFFVLFAIELGVFLIMVPWTGMWERNFLPKLVPHFYEMWISPYMRGAVSGVGVLNLWIALAETISLRRHWVK